MFHVFFPFSGLEPIPLHHNIIIGLVLLCATISSNLESYIPVIKSEVDEVRKIKGQTVSFAEPVITMMRQRHSGVPAIGSSHTTTTSLMNATRRHSETIGPSNTVSYSN